MAGYDNVKSQTQTQSLVSSFIASASDEKELLDDEKHDTSLDSVKFTKSNSVNTDNKSKVSNDQNLNDNGTHSINDSDSHEDIDGIDDSDLEL